MKRFLFAIFCLVSVAGQADSPVWYDVTCYQHGGHYWVGINDLSGDYARLSLDGAGFKDEASLIRVRGSSTFDGYGQSFPGVLPRHFQTVFSRDYSSVTIYFDELGRWVRKASMRCERHHL